MEWVRKSMPKYNWRIRNTPKNITVGHMQVKMCYNNLHGNSESIYIMLTGYCYHSYYLHRCKSPKHEWQWHDGKLKNQVANLTTDRQTETGFFSRTWQWFVPSQEHSCCAMFTTTPQRYPSVSNAICDGVDSRTRLIVINVIKCMEQHYIIMGVLTENGWIPHSENDCWVCSSALVNELSSLTFARTGY